MCLLVCSVQSATHALQDSSVRHLEEDHSCSTHPQCVYRCENPDTHTQNTTQLLIYEGENKNKVT